MARPRKELQNSKPEIKEEDAASASSTTAEAVFFDEKESEDSLEQAPKEPINHGSYDPFEEQVLVEEKKEVLTNIYMKFEVNNPHTHPGHNGLPIYLKNEDKEVLSYWKRTRRFSTSVKRWEDTGVWTDYISGQPIDFIPTEWKPRF